MSAETPRDVGNRGLVAEIAGREAGGVGVAGSNGAKGHERSW